MLAIDNTPTSVLEYSVMPYHMTSKSVLRRNCFPSAYRDETVRETFYKPIWLGQSLTPEVLAHKPDPYLIETNKKDLELPTIFGGDLLPWHFSEHVRNLLERLEPGRHNFIPIQPRHAHSNLDFGTFFILHTTAAINAVVVEETRFAAGIGRKAYEECPQLSGFGPTVLEKSKISGHHLWRGGIAEWAAGAIRLHSTTSALMSSAKR